MKDAGILTISRGEKFNLWTSDCVFDRQSFCKKVLLKYKEMEKKLSDIDDQKGQEEAPPQVVFSIYTNSRVQDEKGNDSKLRSGTVPSPHNSFSR